ncbi:hypothetical protein CCAX7_004290 [Capsulimonas corticalis]|uniref:Uncharacterized protein n=1 Tax=Capsulimonas corticalis TaxID=2219043 RepID=A0A402D317_9BACT|nr:hypothetical protein [Capsulimonas corticalis]BDI28378.1 hypothetical protein CCAX7_004290 [Capsulimonas corticalis]
MSSLRLMLELKLKLTWRGYRRSTWKILGAILLLLAFLPVSGFVSFGLWWLLNNVGPSLQMPIARDALTVVFVIWAVTPLLGFQLNESYDLTKLFVYPISYQTIFVGSVLGGLLDTPVLLMLPPLVVLLVHFSPNFGAGVLNFLLLTSFLLLTLALAQLITLTLVGFLRSRRFRDITVVLFPLIGLCYYVGQQVLVRRFSTFSHNLLSPQILNAPPWRIADRLPSGFAASGLEATAANDWGRALLLLVLILAAGAAIAAAAARVLRQLYLGDAGPGIARIGQPSAATPLAKGPQLPGWLPETIAAIAAKEFVYLRRDPQYKALAVQSVFYLVMITAPIFMPAVSSGRALPSFFGDYIPIALSGALLLSMAPLIFNCFGGEGAAISVLFSLPVSRRDILLGKNLAHLVMLVALNAAGLLLSAAFSGHWEKIPITITWVLLASPVLLAAGNLISVQLPHRMIVRGQRWQKGGAPAAGGDSAGCAVAFLHLLAYGVTLLALFPVAMAILLPAVSIISPAWYALSLPLAAVYSIALYGILLGQAETWLLRREPEIAAQVTPPD